jgi:hypothetical protein
MNYTETMNKYYPDGQKPDPNYNALDDPEFVKKRQEDNQKHAEYMRQRKENDPAFRERCREISKKSRNKQQGWKPVPETKTPVATGCKIAVARKGKEASPNPEGPLTPEEVSQGLNQLMDQTFSKLPIPQSDGTIKTLQEVMGRTNVNTAIDNIPTRRTRPNRHYRDPNYASAVQTDLERQYGTTATKHQKAQAWKQKHDYDNKWEDQTSEAVRRAKERAETVQDDDIYIRAITAEQERKPTSSVQRPMAYQDLRRYPNSPKHNQISWMSCTAHYCALHRQEKIGNNCFPLNTKAHVHQRPYIIDDTMGYRLSKQYLENEVMKFTAHTETRERALAHIQNRRSIDQWKHRVKSTTPVNLRTREEDDERLIRKWQQNTKGDPDRGDTPDPETLRQWEEAEENAWQADAELQEELRRKNECPDDALCYDSECDLRHPSQPGKDNSLLY